MQDDSSIADLGTARAELRAFWQRARALRQEKNLAPSWQRQPFATFELGVETDSEMGMVTTSAERGSQVIDLELLTDRARNTDR